jgi:hypothetical protein
VWLCCFYQLNKTWRPKGPEIDDGACGQPLLVRDFAICHIAWGVTSQFDIFVSHRSNALFWVTLLTVLVTLTAGLHVGSVVSCHNFPRFVYASIDNLGQAVYISNLK